MKVKDIVNLIETIAPREYQESYDNAGLIIGHLEQEITSVLCCLDSTEAVVDEAIEKGCHLILAHHPLIFKGIKRINGNNDVERVIIKAIQHHIAIYAAHTNLDNVYIKGVNQKLAGKIGLQSLKILQQKANQLVKIQIYTPKEQAEAIQEDI